MKQVAFGVKNMICDVSKFYYQFLNLLYVSLYVHM